MRKRGGPGTLREKCVARICVAPVSSDARPPRVTPTPPRSSPPPNTPLPEFGHESQPELLEVWNEQQRLRNCVPPRWAPAGERVKAGLQPYPPIDGRGRPRPREDARPRRPGAAARAGATRPRRTTTRPRRSLWRTATRPRRSRRTTTRRAGSRGGRRRASSAGGRRRARAGAGGRRRAAGDGDAVPRRARRARGVGRTSSRRATRSRASPRPPTRCWRRRPAVRAALPDGDCEDLSSVRLAKEYYDHWKPDEVRAIVLAESHVFTAPEEQAAKRLSDAAFERLRREHGYDGPRGYVRLVNCLGYGEQALCADGRAADRGSTQFWQLLAACSRELAPATPATPVVGPGGQLSDVLKLGSPRLADRTRGEVPRHARPQGAGHLAPRHVRRRVVHPPGDVLRAVGAERRGPAQGEGAAAEAVQDARAGALVGALHEARRPRGGGGGPPAKALIPIGAEVFAAIGLDRLRAAAPGAVVPGEAFPGAQRLGPGRLRALLRLPLGDLRAGADVANVPRSRPQTTGRAAPAAAPAAAPSAVVTPGPAAAAAAAPPSAVVTPGKVPKPRVRAPRRDLGRRQGRVGPRAATPPPAPVVEAEPAAADEELTEWRAAVGDEWADWRGCICNGPYHGSMVGCDGGCDNWFHFACVGITRLPRGEFYCEECKARREAKRRRLEAAASTPRRRRARTKNAARARRRRRGRRRTIAAAPARRNPGGARRAASRLVRRAAAGRPAAVAPCGAQASLARPGGAAWHLRGSR